MLAVRLPELLEQRLQNLAEKTGRPKSYYAKIAIADYLDEHEEYFLALSRLEKGNPRITLEEMEKRFDVDD